MKIPVLLGALAASLLLAVINNLINPHGVPWVGGGEILPKPEGWPSLTVSQGVAAAFKVAMNLFAKHKVGILAVLAGVPAAMVLLKKFRGDSPSAILLSVLRVLLACMFLQAAHDKFLEPDDFAKLVTQYQFLPLPLVNFFSVWMSSAEIVVALGLILTPWEKEFSALIGLLMGMFIVALTQALARGLGIACGCFDLAGAADAGETWFSLIRDIVLMVPIAWMVLAGGRRWLWQLRPAA